MTLSNRVANGLEEVDVIICGGKSIVANTLIRLLMYTRWVVGLCGGRTYSSGGT
jgi:hypothetical protein